MGKWTKLSEACARNLAAHRHNDGVKCLCFLRLTRLLFMAAHAHVFADRNETAEPMLERSLVIREEIGDPETLLDGTVMASALARNSRERGPYDLHRKHLYATLGDDVENVLFHGEQGFADMVVKRQWSSDSLNAFGRQLAAILVQFRGAKVPTAAVRQQSLGGIP